MGRALYSLRQHNIAIIGSGFASFHNLRLMFSQAAQSSAFRERNAKWSRAVTEAVETEEIDERGRRLEGWRNWPHTYESHPNGGAEHFLPLIVAAGAGGQGKAKSYADEFMGMQMYSYYWE
jgi:aromatic ring-opening dioxygenase catalytic subunit (LigB family)